MHFKTFNIGKNGKDQIHIELIRAFKGSKVFYNETQIGTIPDAKSLVSGISFKTEDNHIVEIKHIGNKYDIRFDGMFIYDSEEHPAHAIKKYAIGAWVVSIIYLVIVSIRMSVIVDWIQFLSFTQIFLLIMPSTIGFGLHILATILFHRGKLAAPIIFISLYGLGMLLTIYRLIVLFNFNEGFNAGLIVALIYQLTVIVLSSFSFKVLNDLKKYNQFEKRIQYSETILDL